MIATDPCNNLMCFEQFICKNFQRTAMVPNNVTGFSHSQKKLSPRLLLISGEIEVN